MTRVLDEEGHPYVGTLLATIRDQFTQRDRFAFRGAMLRLGEVLAYEIAWELPTRVREVVTPLGTKPEPVFEDPPVLAVILRAAIPLWEGMLNVFRESDTIVVGAARREGVIDPSSRSLGIDVGYFATVPLEGRTLVYADPMIATGSTLRAVHPILCERAGRPARVFLAGAIGHRETLSSLARDLDARVIVASADDQLTDRGYIVPGLGDAGDLVFGTKL